MTAAEVFGTLPDGRPVSRHRIGAGDLEAYVLPWGGIVQDLRYRGRRVVVGADMLDPYLAELRYAGAMVGRYANRIGGARFTLDGATWHTDPNFRDRHTLHGGAAGAGDRLWTVEEARPDALRLSLTLPDGDMGFPGELTVSVFYTIRPPATLHVEIEARTTRATPCSFAHHGYFILDDSGTVLDHDLFIGAERYLAVDDDLIPAGPPAPVAGTAFDFRDTRRIGTAGYDHNFCLSEGQGPLRPVARLSSAESGVRMEVATTEPGLQVYDGSHLSGAPGHAGRRLKAHAGLAMETQAWPDSPNRPDFPDCILRPGDTYRAETSYSFSTRDQGRRT
jgi:aldose 1-epimerase